LKRWLFLNKNLVNQNAIGSFSYKKKQPFISFNVSWWIAEIEA